MTGGLRILKYILAKGKLQYFATKSFMIYISREQLGLPQSLSMQSYLFFIHLKLC